MINYNPRTKKYLLANLFTFKAESFDTLTLIQRTKFKPDRTRSLKQGIVRKIARYYKTRLGRKRAKLFAKGAPIAKELRRSNKLPRPSQETILIQAETSHRRNIVMSFVRRVNLSDIRHSHLTCRCTSSVG